MNKEVRRLVFERAHNLCEAGCGRPAAHLDHAFGRAKAPETVATCWALCERCDHLKTTNHPTGDEWWKKFAAHCRKHGYIEEAARAENRLFFLQVKFGRA